MYLQRKKEAARDAPPLYFMHRTKSQECHIVIEVGRVISPSSFTELNHDRSLCS